MFLRMTARPFQDGIRRLRSTLGHRQIRPRQRTSPEAAETLVEAGRRGRGSERMKIEIGYYRTRDGRKARVECTNAPRQYPCVGWVEPEYDDCSTVLPTSWTGGGVANVECPNHPRDLISPWIDAPIVNWPAMPAWANWVAMTDTANWFWFSQRPTLNDVGWGRPVGGLYDQIPSGYTPTFTGRWQDSLVERPRP